MIGQVGGAEWRKLVRVLTAGILFFFFQYRNIFIIKFSKLIYQNYFFHCPILTFVQLLSFLMDFLIHLSLSFFSKIPHWSIVDLQCCVSFRGRAKSFCYTCAYIHSYLLRVSSHIGHYRVSNRVPRVSKRVPTLQQVLVSYLFYIQQCIYDGEGNGNPLQYSCLETPMDGGAWQAAVHGVAKSRTRLSDFTFTFHFHALEKDMATHSSVLAWRIPETGEPGGLPSVGSHRVGHD